MVYAKPERELALALLGAGVSVTEVAAQLGVSRRSVQRWRASMPEATTSTAQQPQAAGVSPELTLASIARDARMPAGARVQAAKSLIDLTPRLAPTTAPPDEMTEFERFDVSIMAATVHVEALRSGQHSLSANQLSELQASIATLRGVLEKAPGADMCRDEQRPPDSEAQPT